MRICVAAYFLKKSQPEFFFFSTGAGPYYPRRNPNYGVDGQMNQTQVLRHSSYFLVKRAEPKTTGVVRHGLYRRPWPCGPVPGQRACLPHHGQLRVRSVCYNSVGGGKLPQIHTLHIPPAIILFPCRTPPPPHQHPRHTDGLRVMAWWRVTTPPPKSCNACPTFIWMEHSFFREMNDESWGNEKIKR